eukprot:COSAG01_NODE_11292_length_1965_cov_1.444266_1_plen_99_part_00
MAIQTLHGVCFVFFWIAIVEHAQRIASTSTLATAQSLVSTCYYVLGAGVGSLLWGFVYQQYGALVAYRAGAACSLFNAHLVWKLDMRTYAVPGGLLPS